MRCQGNIVSNVFGNEKISQCRNAFNPALSLTVRGKLCLLCQDCFEYLSQQNPILNPNRPVDQLKHWFNSPVFTKKHTAIHILKKIILSFVEWFNEDVKAKFIAEWEHIEDDPDFFSETYRKSQKYDQLGVLMRKTVFELNKTPYSGPLSMSLMTFFQHNAPFQYTQHTTDKDELTEKRSYLSLDYPYYSELDTRYGRVDIEKTAGGRWFIDKDKLNKEMLTQQQKLAPTTENYSKFSASYGFSTHGISIHSAQNSMPDYRQTSMCELKKHHVNPKVQLRLSQSGMHCLSKWEHYPNVIDAPNVVLNETKFLPPIHRVLLLKFKDIQAHKAWKRSFVPFVFQNRDSFGFDTPTIVERLFDGDKIPYLRLSFGLGLFGNCKEIANKILSSEDLIEINKSSGYILKERDCCDVFLNDSIACDIKKVALYHLYRNQVLVSHFEKALIQIESFDFLPQPLSLNFMRNVLTHHTEKLCYVETQMSDPVLFNDTLAFHIIKKLQIIYDKLIEIFIILTAITSNAYKYKMPLDVVVNLKLTHGEPSKSKHINIYLTESGMHAAKLLEINVKQLGYYIFIDDSCYQELFTILSSTHLSPNFKIHDKIAYFINLTEAFVYCKTQEESIQKIIVWVNSLCNKIKLAAPKAKQILLAIDYTRYGMNLPNSVLFPTLIKAFGDLSKDISVVFWRSCLKYGTMSTHKFQHGEILCVENLTSLDLFQLMSQRGERASPTDINIYFENFQFTTHFYHICAEMREALWSKYLSLRPVQTT